MDRFAKNNFLSFFLPLFVKPHLGKDPVIKKSDTVEQR